MTTPKDLAAFDQAIATVVDTVPAATSRFYEKLVEEGFSETQAIFLTRDFMINLLSPLPPK